MDFKELGCYEIQITARPEVWFVRSVVINGFYNNSVIDDMYFQGSIFCALIMALELRFCNHYIIMHMLHPIKIKKQLQVYKYKLIDTKITIYG